jgi:hypothetical protein
MAAAYSSHPVTAEWASNTLHPPTSSLPIRGLLAALSRRILAAYRSATRSRMLRVRALSRVSAVPRVRASPRFAHCLVLAHSRVGWRIGTAHSVGAHSLPPLTSSFGAAGQRRLLWPGSGPSRLLLHSPAEPLELFDMFVGTFSAPRSVEPPPRDDDHHRDAYRDKHPPCNRHRPSPHDLRCDWIRAFGPSRIVEQRLSKRIIVCSGPHRHISPPIP